MVLAAQLFVSLLAKFPCLTLVLPLLYLHKHSFTGNKRNLGFVYIKGCSAFA